MPLNNMKQQTIALNTKFSRRDPYGALSMPVYHTAAYEFDSAADMADAFTGRVIAPDYSRTMNPTVCFLEDKVKALTGATDTIAFTSGMAAICNTMLALSAAGKNIVTSKHLFGNTYSLLSSTLKRFGVECRCCDLTNADEVDSAADGNTCCIFVEIITNPQMEVADLKALARVAHKYGIPLIADTTTIPFTVFSSKALGVDIEIVSSTKYLSGGATSLGGLIIDYGNFPDFTKCIRSEMLFNVGAYMTPHAAYMQTLGLETLDARYRVQSQSALELAKAMKDMPGIKSVNYVGLVDNPYHRLARQQFGHTAGAMVCIDLEDQDACFRFINKLKVVRRATNLFDNKSLAIHPYSTIFGNFTPEEKASMDVLPTTIRLSVGLEDVNDIIDDIRQASE